jgi:Tfp pilus assembly protein PilO
MKISNIKIKDNQLALLICIGLVMAVYLFYNFIFLPQKAGLDELIVQRQQEEMKLKVIEDFQNSHANVDEYLNDLEGKKRELARALPENNDMRDFLLQVEKAAQDGGVSLERVKYDKFAGQSEYSKMPVEIVVKGTYFQILSFTKLLESISRFTAMQKIVIKVDKEMIECTINTNVYMYGIVTPSKQGEKKQPKK